MGLILGTDGVEGVKGYVGRFCDGDRRMVRVGVGRGFLMLKRVGGLVFGKVTARSSLVVDWYCTDCCTL